METPEATSWRGYPDNEIARAQADVKLYGCVTSRRMRQYSKLDVQHKQLGHRSSRAAATILALMLLLAHVSGSKSPGSVTHRCFDKAIDEGRNTQHDASQQQPCKHHFEA